MLKHNPYERSYCATHSCGNLSCCKCRYHSCFPRSACNCCLPAPQCCLGATGPTGPTGATGPVGPTGADGTNLLSGLQVQLQNSPHGLVPDQGNVLFDRILNGQPSDISYDQSTGEFLLLSNKNYYVSWWLTLNGSEYTATIDFAVMLDGHVVAAASMPQVTCQMSGTALVPVTSAPGILSITNVSGNSIRYANTSVQANIVIVEII